jgi:hypothetical protein
MVFLVFHGFSIVCRSSRHFLRQLPPESCTTARGSVLHQRVYLVPGTKPAPTDGDFDGFIKKEILFMVNDGLIMVNDGLIMVNDG